MAPAVGEGRVTVVTGGAGFIGGALVRALCAAGRRVRVLDDLSAGRPERIAGLGPLVELVLGDVRDGALLGDVMADAGTVFHMAARTAAALSLADPEGVHDVNATGTVRVLEAARRAGVARAVVASSAAVYGDPGEGARAEDAPAAPATPYAASKVAAEAYGRACAESLGLPVVVLRYFNVYGPGQDAAGPHAAVVARFARGMARGEPPVIHGDGRQTRDFVHIDDAVAASLLAEGGPAGAYNVATGRASDVLGLVDALNLALGTDLAPTFAPARPAEIRRSLGDPRRAREALGFAARVPLAEGLRGMAQGAALL